MNNLLIKFIAGFVCTARWTKEHSYVAAHLCDTHYLTNVIEVDCNSKGIHSVPVDLDNNAKILDLSNNDICEFTQESFSGYLAIHQLQMTDLKCSSGKPNPCAKNFITIDNNTFVNSNLLRILDISNSPICGFGSAKFEWPKNLIELKLHNSHHIEFQFSELLHLQILQASNCDKHFFPELHPTAPLYEIDISNNNISFVTVEMIAGYCDLNVLMMSILLDDLKVNSSEDQRKPPYDDFNCMYMRFIKWAELRSIGGLEKLKCIKKEENSKIEVPCTSKIQCDLSFDKANQLYNSCLGTHLSIFMMILIALVFLIITVLIMVLITWYLKKSFSAYRRSEIIHNHRHERDFPNSFYESGYEVESEDHKFPNRSGPKKISAKEFPSQSLSKKKSSKKTPSRPTPNSPTSQQISSQSTRR